MPTIVDSTSTSTQSPVPLSAPHSGRGQNGRHEPTPSVTPGQRHTSTSEEEGNNNDTTHQQQPSFSSTPQEPENDDDEWLVACRCENGKTLVTLLSCLQDVAANPSDLNTTTSSTMNTSSSTTQSSRFSQKQRKRRKKIQPVTIFCTPSGFTFHVCGPAKQSEASIELQKTMFSQYQVRQDGPDQADWQAGGEFCVNLTTVMDALQWLGPLDGRTSVGLSYNLQTEIFKVELLHDSGGSSSSATGGGVLCTTAIPGLMAPEDDAEGNSLSNAFRSSPVAARMMVRSGILRDLLPELIVTGASTACVAVSAKKGLEIAVLGHYGEAWIQIPSTGDHMVSPLELADQKKTVTRSYAMHSLISSMKGLEISEESVLSINSQGIMAIQHKTIDPTCQGSSNFVDFIMTCLEDEDEEEDEENVDPEEEATISQQSATQASLQSQVTASQTTAAATPRGRRKRVPRASSTAGDDDEKDESRQSTPQNMSGGDDDIVQGNSDAEGDGESPRERQQLQAQKRRKQSKPTPSSSDDDSDDDANDNATSSLAAPLSLVRPSSTHGTGSGTETPPRRRQRLSTSRARSRPSPAAKKPRNKSRKRNQGNDSDGSKNMLESDDDEDDDDQSSGDEGHLDLEALARSPTREQQPREDECASPELVYG